ncbi:unnamed protein product [Dovyalis caffra]|uniref:Uncharacterized protein n=1 Tax=Dovyalis caffra TaxID=77055 RepID=A0AAV1S6F9_9ROSI|nr:unnamed protein product [Dovyalis caffra]
MSNYSLAIEFQQRAVDAWDSHGPSAQNELMEASRILEQLKTKARDAFTNQLLTEALPMPHSNPSGINSLPDNPLNENQTSTI